MPQSAIDLTAVRRAEADQIESESVDHISDEALQFAAWNHAALLLRSAELNGLSSQRQAGQTRKNCDILLHKFSTIIFIFQNRDIAGSPLAKAQFPTAELEEEIPKNRCRLFSKR